LILLISVITLIITFLTAIIGIGSTILFNPVMVWIGFNLQNDVIPAGLILSMMGAGYVSWKHYRRNASEIKPSIPSILAAITGAVAGAYLTTIIPAYKLFGFFALVVLVAGIWMLFPDRRESDRDPCCEGGLHFILTLLTALGLGMLAGLTGIAGGFLILPILLWLGYSKETATGMAALVTLFAAIAGFTVYFQIATINWEMVKVSAIAGIIGLRLGSHLSASQPKRPKILEQVLGAILVLLAGSFIWRFFA